MKLGLWGEVGGLEGEKGRSWRLGEMSESEGRMEEARGFGKMREDISDDENVLFFEMRDSDKRM